MRFRFVNPKMECIVSLLILVCMKLPQKCYVEDVQDGDEWAVDDNTRDDIGQHKVRAFGECR